MMALGAIGAEQLRRCLAGSEILRRRRGACACGHQSKNENRDLLHSRGTLGFMSRLFNAFERRGEDYSFDRARAVATILANFCSSLRRLSKARIAPICRDIRDRPGAKPPQHFRRPSTRAAGPSFFPELLSCP